ncbi:hypothetical protein DPMN_054587 [Dreissena polymorpha]|uniref:Uncharacterized protein n=2 Tax=Dreissena polymorpha TaxID=45954 RepID=A0A9D4CNE0_DREPO|nr:hypothetical protein DPMN_054587 [Dreissena polymorpha]
MTSPRTTTTAKSPSKSGFDGGSFGGGVGLGLGIALGLFCVYRCYVASKNKRHGYSKAY